MQWLRHEENQYLSCPPAVARTLPRDLQKLAGYTIGAYALGYVDELREPRRYCESWGMLRAPPSTPGDVFGRWSTLVC